jgi:flagellar export protein FliJ
VAISRGLSRLLGIREAEEQHRRSLLDGATAELHRLENAIRNAEERSRLGRARIASSVQSGDAEDRVAGLEEIAASDRLRAALLRRTAAAKKQVDELRREYLAKRIERRQAETLVDVAKAKEAVELNRRAQRELDDRHLRQRSSAPSSRTRIVPERGTENDF